ncbi:MAG: peptidoglycan DD-metalloendopeptidase family protein [Oscillospiraceae bacterium]|nr:peptidoglycan DD-metalloendopeptidase family protein [Oscillospiraceae bacterium]
MEEKKGFGETLNTFFAGKGFYIVLLLCAGLIATSIWLMADGSRTDVEADSGRESALPGAVAAENQEAGDDSVAAGTGSRSSRREVSVPVMETEETPVAEVAPEAPAVNAQPATAREEPETAETAAEMPAGYFIWPVNGPVERPYSVETLSYDRTMSDWRAHGGVDLGAPAGSQVLSVNNGTVSAVYRDEMLGSVVEVDHGDGLVSVYANLQDAPSVRVGQSVCVGDVLGTVGTTALGESGETSHLHFAMRQNGVTANPSLWLPER